jgi:hypothetical protein
VTQNIDERGQRDCRNGGGDQRYKCAGALPRTPGLHRTPQECRAHEDRGDGERYQNLTRDGEVQWHGRAPCRRTSCVAAVVGPHDAIETLAIEAVSLETGDQNRMRKVLSSQLLNQLHVDVQMR